ncbi:SNF2 family N-terminal domain-containing protein [Cantharellus anzutake]|uniref:SNF2 family N-terminal domain-containing protein n=1 Tax=Cantharellus anzutake TaxID=1750568 RepID=UPI001903EE5A|nr:SNF2 family N-terminal domain-containing protein [Cantharellus anzutake]KAF8343895.1 SNF2 family N-terminal domain-containing protein [Cantharellus anzutake]
MKETLAQAEIPSDSNFPRYAHEINKCLQLALEGRGAGTVVDSLEGERRLPVWKHSFTLYIPLLFGELAFNETVSGEMCSALDKLPQQSIRIGEGLLLRRARTKALDVSFGPSSPNAREKLGELGHILLPIPPHEIRITDEFISQTACGSELLAAADLCSLHGRMSVLIEVNIRAVHQNEQRQDLRCLPFCFEVQFWISLCLPDIFQPSEALPKHAAEAQARIFSFLFVPQLPGELAYPGETNVSFFFSCLQPAPELPPDVSLHHLQPPALEVALYPFQRKSVFWMLQREGMTIDGNGCAVPAPLSCGKVKPLFWTRVPNLGQDLVTGKEEHWWYNRLTGDLRNETGRPAEEIFQGGILAESMGLGKTVEVIALILHHPATSRNELPSKYDVSSDFWVKPVKGTLIVTPTSLQQQWIEEIETHAPTLRLLVYDGWAKLRLPQEHTTESVITTRRKRKLSGSPYTNEAVSQWFDYAQIFDVIITTYDVLRADLYVARPSVKRSRRSNVDYAEATVCPRSPLVILEFSRVVMDEVQQIGGGRAAEMVSLVPRVSSIAVSGTPAKASVKDLVYPLRFLRVPQISSMRQWETLLQPQCATEFVDLFGAVAVRTSKGAIAEEAPLPPQRRVLVPIELGAIERHNYHERFRSGLLNLGLDAQGNLPSIPELDLDIVRLRAFIRGLRQACTHPLVGNLPGAHNRNVPNVIRSIQDVLKDMIQQTRRSLLDSRREEIHALVGYALLIQKDSNVVARKNDALNLLLETRARTENFINDVKLYIHEELTRPEGGGTTNVTGHEIIPPDFGTSHSDDEDLIDTYIDETAEVIGLDESAGADPRKSYRHGLFQRLRDARILLHRIKFSLGDIYHAMGENGQEVENYDAAEVIRQSILKRAEDRANRAIDELAQSSRNGISRADLVIEPNMSLAAFPKLAKLTAETQDAIDLLDKQAQLLWKWREKIISLLSERLGTDSSHSGPDGNEYTRSLEVQGQAESYLQSWAALLADRKEALIAERTALAAHEDREVQSRRTKRAMDAVASGTAEHDLESAEQPELTIQLTIQRRAMRRDHTRMPLKAAAVAFRTHDEIPGVLDESLRLHNVIATQTTLMNALENELRPIRKAFNARVLYFRQLQHISDSVADEELPEGMAIQTACEDAREKAEEAAHKTQTLLAKSRYLTHLATQQASNQASDDDECVMCKSEFDKSVGTKGFMTSCAHSTIGPSTLHRIASYHHVIPSATDAGVMSKPIPNIPYRRIENSLMSSINATAAVGDYGSKIQTLAKHILMIQESDPKAKSIVFSAWSDSLHIISHALTSNGIRHLKIDSSAKSNAVRLFSSDESISVLLLHGERDNAGLNIIAAKYVFLLEPVVNHAFEVQAIARVDRLGQNKATSVFCYYAEDTIERNILDLAYRRGQSLYVEGGIELNGDIASDDHRLSRSSRSKSRALDKGDSIASVDDMLTLLFPELYGLLNESEEDQLRRGIVASLGTTQDDRSD